MNELALENVKTEIPPVKNIEVVQKSGVKFVFKVGKRGKKNAKVGQILNEVA